MAVTTTFSVQTIKGEFNISRTPANETNPSLLALADGGFAVLRAGSGNLDSVDKWIFCLNAA